MKRSCFLAAGFALMLVITMTACAAESPPASAGEDASAAAPTAPTKGEDWPRFLGPRGDGTASEKIRLDWPTDGLEVLWFRGVGEGYSAPSVAAGRLFVFDREGGEARLAAWDAATGKELWRTAYATDYEDLYQYSGGPRTSPVVDGDRVYVYGVEGRLRAHAVADGALLWEVDTAARFGMVQNFFGVGATPVVEGDLLIAQVGGSPAGSPSISSGEVQGNGSGVVAFDKRTGEVRYQFSDELASYATPRIVHHGDRLWAFVFSRGGLLAFEPSKGEQDFFFPWRARKLESVNAATPVVVGDTVFISESYGPGSALLRFRPGGYEVVWKDPPRGKSMETHWSTPIAHQGFLYGSSGQSSGEAELRAVELATGTVKWRQPDLGRSTLLYADGHLLVLTETGRLLLVEANPERYVKVAEMDLGAGADTSNAAAKAPSSGKTAKAQLNFPVWNAPVLAHGRLYLRGRDQIVALDLAPRGGG